MTQTNSSPNTSPGPLAGLRVLEYAQFISGPYCGKMLADLGAEVIKVEPPAGGDRSRRYGPFPGDAPHPERSGLFLYLNTNKQGIILDLAAPDGLELLHRLLDRSDILVYDLQPAPAASLALSYPELHERHPGLIVTSITPYGHTDPARDLPASDLTVSHQSWTAFETPQHGVESLDLPPLRVAGYSGLFLAGTVAATATLTAVFARALDGEGRHVDVSELEALTGVMLRINLHQYTYEGKQPTRLWPTQRQVDYVPCRDGYVNIQVHFPHWWRNLLKVMGDPTWAQEPLFQDADFRDQGWDVVEPLLEEWAKHYTRQELFEMLQRAHVPCLPGYTFADVVEDPHLNARGYFVEVDHGERGNVRFPGAPYRLSRTPWALRCPAPQLGQHNELVFSERLGVPKQDLVRLRGWGVL